MVRFPARAEISTRNLPGGKADNLTANCEPIVLKMWEPRRLTTLCASTASDRDCFTVYLYLFDFTRNEAGWCSGIRFEFRPVYWITRHSNCVPLSRCIAGLCFQIQQDRTVVHVSLPTPFLASVNAVETFSNLSVSNTPLRHTVGTSGQILVTFISFPPFLCIPFPSLIFVCRSS
jgi:hypothetical protein